MATQNVCKHHNVGYCKYKDKCIFFHATEDWKNVREIHALKDTEKPVGMEKVANLNLSVNSGMMRKQKQMYPIKYLN